MKNVIVIGAGVSGLATALRLQSKGYKVEIYEKNSNPGGRMGKIENNGFQFDLGPTIVMMPHIYKEVFEACGVNPDDYIRMEKLDPIYNVYFDDGTMHSASSDLPKLINSLEEIGYQETAGYLAYLADIYKRYLIAKDHFIDKSFRHWTDFYNPKTLYNALKLKTFDNAYDSVGKFVKNDKLKELLSFQTLYIGISPFNGPSIYTIIPMIELTYGVWYIKGGMYAMAAAMEKLFLELGGKIFYNKTVEKVVVKDNKAVGIKVDKKVINADYVVCTADFPHALDKLLPTDYKNGKYSKNNIEKLEYSCSCYMMYLGIDNNNYKGLNVHNLVFSSDFKQNLEEIFKGKFPTDPSIYVYAPGVIDDSLAPKNKLGLYVLVPVPNLKDNYIDWRDDLTLSNIREQVLNQVDKIKPLKGFRKHLISEKIYTPLDWNNDFNAMFGTTFGLKPTLLQSNYFRPQPKAHKIDNLYFAGASTHPGAGVPIVLTSAKLAVQELMKDDKR